MYISKYIHIYITDATEAADLAEQQAERTTSEYIMLPSMLKVAHGSSVTNLNKQDSFHTSKESGSSEKISKKMDRQSSFKSLKRQQSRRISRTTDIPTLDSLNESDGIHVDEEREEKGKNKAEEKKKEKEHKREEKGDEKGIVKSGSSGGGGKRTAVYHALIGEDYLDTFVSPLSTPSRRQSVTHYQSFISGSAIIKH